MSDPQKAKFLHWAVLGLFFVLWFWMLDARTLIPTDEGRYAEMSREMAATCDWITPRLNGIKYFEKPPLQIWATALAFKAFGLGEWQARLWTGLCGLLGIFLTGIAGARLFGRDIGLAASALLASSFMWSLMGHMNTLDMGLSAMMTASLCGLLIAQRGNAPLSEQRNWMLVSWAGMALAVMSKGLIGVVLPGAVLVIYTLVTHQWSLWKRLHFLPGLALFFAITAPWFVLVSLKHPEFARFFFIHEHFERFTSKVHHREGPWHYFIPILVAGIVPWLGLLLHSVRNKGSVDVTGFRPKALLLTWTVFIFMFFSLSGSKLPSYILPIFPALALLIAPCLPRLSRKGWLMVCGLAAAPAVAGLALLPRLLAMRADPAEAANYAAAQPWATAGLLALLSGAALAWRLSCKRHEQAWLHATFALAAGGFLCSQLLMAAAEPQGRYRAGLHLVPAIEAELQPSTPLYAVGMYDQTLPFYLGRTTMLVQHPDEMEFGLEQEPALWLPRLEDFIERWKNGPKAVAITRPEIYEKLQRQALPMRIVARDTRRVVITNELNK